MLTVCALTFLFCGQKKKEEAPGTSLPKIAGSAALDSVLRAAGSQMVVLDLYADWCMPCRILEPVLHGISKQYEGRAQFYRINVDDNQEISRTFGVRGIPYVVFMRNGSPVHALTGVNPRESYEKVIVSCANAGTPEECAKNMQ